MPQVGDIVHARYRLTRRIGEGGWGVVFEAARRDGGEPVALKLIHPHIVDDPARLERFLREGRTVLRLASPHTVTVFEVGTDTDAQPPVAYITMELLRGESLEEALKRGGPQPPDRVAWWADQVLRSLAEAHALGIVHRDLKPANIFLHHAPSGPTVKLLDFGIAKTIVGDTDRSLTAEGVILGTPQYMAPEQAAGGAIGPWTDLYALGLVMAEALTGAPVYHDDNPLQICLRQASDPVVPLPDAVLNTPIGPVIQRAVAKPAPDRYPTPDAMRDALARAQPAPAPPAPSAPPPSPAPAAAPPAPPRAHDAPDAQLSRVVAYSVGGVMVLMVLLLIGILLILLAVVWLTWDEPPSEAALSAAPAAVAARVTPSARLPPPAPPG